jgi:hypothetical protein
MNGLSTFKRGQRAIIVMLAASGLTLGMTGISQASGVTVSDLNNGATTNGLAQSLAGGGVSISNVTYTGDNRAAGTFTAGMSSIGFDEGIVLDSGKVQTYPSDPPCSQGVEGPNTCYETIGSDNSTAFGTLGDSDLTSLSGFQTFDASVLEFDFVPQHSTVQFSYVFSSEEYSDFANTQFNDVFGFFVNGTNCALVPGTTEPVSVNTINNGNDRGGDTTPHHANLFRDNVNPSPSIDSQMDGLTTVLTCTATVTQGQTNHMKLAIADASDAVLDSAVFIQAGSLVSGTQISTSLKGGGQSGAKITVPTSTAVTDSSALVGAGASGAGGTVDYKVYSDPGCSKEFADASTKTVTKGVAPDSDPITFNQVGTYYWQASYGGDANNNPSKSTCGDETVTVTGGCAIADKKVSPFTDVTTGNTVLAEDNLASTITSISPGNSAPEHLVVRGNGRFFALTGLTSVLCHDNTAYPLDSGNKFNTVSGDGPGTLGTAFGNGKPGYTAHWEFSDRGDQPNGTDTGGDTINLIVYDSTSKVVWHVNGKFTTASQEETG